MGFSRQYWSGLPFPSLLLLVDPILSLLQWTTFCQYSARVLKWFAIPFSTMTHPSWVALHGMAHSFTELDKALVHVIRLVTFLWWWFHAVCPLMPSPSAYLLIEVSPTLDVVYLLFAAGCSSTRQPPLHPLQCLESRFLGEISITSAMQMTPPLLQKVKKN